MKLQVLCQVSKLEAKERYPMKPGSTDPDYLKPKVPYTQSELTVLDNDAGVDGRITIDAELRFGQLVAVSIDTVGQPDVVTRTEAAVDAAMAAVDRRLGIDMVPSAAAGEEAD